VEDRGRPHGQLVTRHMIRKWVKRLTKVRLVVKAVVYVSVHQHVRVCMCVCVCVWCHGWFSGSWCPVSGQTVPAVLL